VKLKYIVGIVIIAVFIAWGVQSFMATTIRYIPIAEAPSSTGTVQVAGMIDFDAVNYDAEKKQLIFDIKGMEETSNDRLTIVYGGVVPGNFDQATSVVVKGKYADGVFVADQLLVKCPSKYQGMEQKA